MSDDVKAIVPTEVRTVDFYGEEITTAMLEEGGQLQIYVALKPIADYLGLNWSGALQRINRDSDLREGMCVIHIPTSSGVQPMACLRIAYLNGFLFTIQPNRVKPDVRDKVSRYRKECFEVLWQHFQAGGPPVPAGVSVLHQVRDLGIALQHLAEQGLAQESRLTQVEDRLNTAARFMGQVQKRLARVEEKVAPSAYLTDEQRAAITTQVRALAVLILSQNPTGKNPFQGVWTELFRELGVSDSNHIPQSKFAPAMAFLETWWRAAAGQHGSTEPA